MMVESARDKMDLPQDAEDYVESVMSTQVAAIVRTPVATIGGRKRQLSVPDESAMKKANGETKEDRDFLKARWTLYKRRDDSSDYEDGGEDQQSGYARKKKVRKTEVKQRNSRTDVTEGNNNKKAKKPRTKQKQSDFEIITTEADVRVARDVFNMDTRGLLMKMCLQMKQHFTALDRKK